MKPLQVTLYPNPILRKKANGAPKPNENLRELINKMILTMDTNEGVGLAAPQIGLSERVIVVKDGEKNYGFLNPRILKEGKKKTIDEEGCLSLPGIFLKIKRAEELLVLAQTAKGKVVQIHAEGLGARIFQHEIDHLQGKLIIDRVSPWKRFQLRKKLAAIKP